MGEKYLGIVRKHSHQKRGMRVVLTAIARFADDNGVAFPGNSILVDETGLCERTIQRCIDNLCETPELRQLEQGNGRGNKRYLQITIPENGYERVTSTQKKGDKWASKDDNMSPFPKKKEPEKTTICHPLESEENIKRVTSSTKKGDILSPESINQLQTETYVSAFAEAKDPTPVPRKTKTREPTEHQRYFAKVCEIVGWDFQTITDGQKGQVAQTVGVLQKAAYTYEELNRFKPEVWVNDWRWAKKNQYPTLSDLRAEIGKLRNGNHAAVPAVATNGKLDFSMGELLK